MDKDQRAHLEDTLRQEFLNFWCLKLWRKPSVFIEGLISISLFHILAKQTGLLYLASAVDYPPEPTSSHIRHALETSRQRAQCPNSHSILKSFLPWHLPVLKLLFTPSVVSNSLQPGGWQPASFLCSWDCPSENTIVGFYFLLLGDLPNPGIYPMSPASLGIQLKETESLVKQISILHFLCGIYHRSQDMGAT